MSADYHLDYRAFGEHVLNAEWMVAHMAERAERMKAFAIAISPFDPDDPDGQHYVDAFEVDAHTHGGVHHDRAVGILRNTDHAALAVEYGNANTPEHAVLRKALDAAG
jgi:hypothetical protein